METKKEFSEKVDIIIDILLKHDKFNKATAPEICSILACVIDIVIQLEDIPECRKFLRDTIVKALSKDEE